MSLKYIFVLTPETIDVNNRKTCKYLSILLVFNGFVMCTMPLGAAANVHKV